MPLPTEKSNEQKHLLPVGKEPMIFHLIKQLVSTGISDILVVTSTNHMGKIVKVLGGGSDFGCKFTSAETGLEIKVPVRNGTKGDFPIVSGE